MSISKHLLFAPLFLPILAHASISYVHVDGYFGRSQNPFIGNPDVSQVYVEDFELPNFTTYPYNYLTTPYATGWNGDRAGSTSAGVREDYDLSGSGDDIGYYWTNSGHTQDTNKPPNGIHFDFTPDSEGRLPEYVGAALRGMTGTSGAFNIILVYDRNGAEVTQGQWQITKIPPGDIPIAKEDLFTGFEGIYVSGGISSILFRDFREVDHLTYGYAIPEPSVAALAAGASLLLWRRRRVTGNN